MGIAQASLLITLNPKPLEKQKAKAQFDDSGQSFRSQAPHVALANLLRLVLNYYNIIGLYRGYMGIRVYWAYVGTMEKKMETTIV